MRTYRFDCFVLSGVFVPNESFILEHVAEAGVLHKGLHIACFLLLQKFIHECSVDFDIGDVGALLHLNAICLLLKTVCDLLLLELGVSVGISYSDQFLVSLERHKETMHVGFQY